jgi:hypothetical protein
VRASRDDTRTLQHRVKRKKKKIYMEREMRKTVVPTLRVRV